MPATLRIDTFPLGDWMTNCYVVHVHRPNQSETPCWIIDAGFSPEPLIEHIRATRLRPEQVVLTHAHVDHIGGLDTIRATWPDIPILIHRDEEAFLADPSLNLSIVLDEPITAPPATRVLNHGDVLTLDGVNFEVRHTPGHSPGGISLYQPQDGIVFAGDALFSGSVGRTDFPTSDPELLFASIRSQLLTLPDATKVYPGHGPSTTIGRERTSNPYLT